MKVSHKLSVANEKATHQDTTSSVIANAHNTRGPYRSACKAGVFVTLCKFDDVYATYDTLKDNHVKIAGSVNILAGYTFQVDCCLEKTDGENASMHFVFSLCSGTWDSYVEWPFEKRVTLVVTHLRRQEKDLRLSLCMEGDTGIAATKKPRPGQSNSGVMSEKVSWEDIEMEGFIDKSTLYLNVEFE